MERRGFRAAVVGSGPAGMAGALRTALEAAGVGTLHAADPEDAALESRLKAFCRANGVALVVHDPPSFRMERAWAEGFFSGRKHYRMAEFYRAVRRKTGLLLDARGKPLGGKWSYDPENRRRVAKGTPIPPAWGAGTGTPFSGDSWDGTGNFSPGTPEPRSSPGSWTGWRQLAASRWKPGARPCARNYTNRHTNTLE